jgi:hypothetical protein
MSFQRSLAAITLLLTTCVAALGASTSEQKRDHLRRLRTDGSEGVNVTTLDRAYLDARTLLTEPGRCGEYFGGNGVDQVLEEFVSKLREERLSDPRIGIRMHGSFKLFGDLENQVSYRLFENAELNTEGPFYRAKVFCADPYVPGVGSFGPNTREARSLILLHELAHLVRNQNGTWLIPDDGNNSPLSRLNTSTVESRCGRQIRAL